jgi:hypothetical protein
MKTYITLFFIALFFANKVYAAAPAADSSRKAQIEQLKKLRKDLFVQKLALTPTESDKFFPIYDEYQLKVKTIKKEFRQKWNGRKPEELSEQEAQQYLNDALKMRSAELDLFKTYSEKLKTAIPVKKIVILPRVEKEVQRELISKAREMKGKGNAGPGPGGIRRRPRGRF